MASVQKTGTLFGTLNANNNHPQGVQFKSCGDPVALAVTFATALAVCVADGASPTQAHVATANTAYTNLAACLGGDINIAFDVTKVTSLNTLRRCFSLALAEFTASGMLPEST